jgi:sensor histidine kinase regulating citrate/malate metabolism
LLADVVKEVIKTYKNNYIGENKEIEFNDLTNGNAHLKTDRTLLRRILGNLLKNALEASKDGDKVTITSEDLNSQIVFNVHNKSFIPRNIELQIFQRSFSTKGSGRGIGTYSVKLLTERYLKGEVSFLTDKKLGTVFTVIIPKELTE